MRAVNLIPSDQRADGAVGARSQGGAFAVLGLLGGLAVLALLYGMAHHQLASRQAEAAALSARAQQYQTQAASLASYTSFVSMREQRLQAISQLVGSRFDWSSVMGELSRVLPDDVALSSLQGTVGSTSGSSSSSSSSPSSHTGGEPVASSTPPGTVPTFTLAGCATSQSVVAQTLLRLRLISGVSAVNLLSSTKSSSGGSGTSDSCPVGDPVFSVQVTFEALPSVPSANIGAIESTVPASTPAARGGQRRTASVLTGAAR